MRRSAIHGLFGRPALVAAVAVQLVAGSAAGQVLDQAVEEPTTGQASISEPFEWAQTFTVGSNGLLTEVHVNVNVDSTAFPIEFDLRPVSGSAPVEPPVEADGAALVTRSITPTATGTQWIEIRGLSVEVTEGQRLAIVLRTPTGGSPGNTWFLNQTGAYTRGSAWCRNTSSPSTSCGLVWTGFFGVESPFNDLQFRTFLVVRRNIGAPAMSSSLVAVAVLLLAAIAAARLRTRGPAA